MDEVIQNTSIIFAVYPISNLLCSKIVWLFNWHGIPQEHIAAYRPGVRYCPQTLRTGSARPLLQRSMAAVRQPGLSHVLPDVPQLHRRQYRTGTATERRGAAIPLLR